MGYACPVCEDPQVDARHLANHLAFTALLGDDAHETWLEEHAPGWDRADDESLAEVVLEYVEEIDFPVDPAAETDHGPSGPEPAAVEADHGPSGPEAHEHDPGVTFDDLGGGPRARSDPVLDDDAKDALREAYEMTRIRRERTEEKPADADDGETE